MACKKTKGYTIKRLSLPLSGSNIADLNSLQACLYPGSTPSLRRCDLERLVRSRIARIFVAVDERGYIVAKGTASLSRGEEGLVGWYDNIVVAKRHRRKGLMTAIHREIMKYLRARRPYTVRVLTHRLRQEGVAFYKRIGFKASGGSLVLVMPT